MADFQEQPGHDPAITALARGLYDQAKSKGLTTYDETPAAPDPDVHDDRLARDTAAVDRATTPEEVEAAPETDEAAPETDEADEAAPETETDEEIYSADAVIRLDDGREVTARELAEGSMMQADYTRKTQELAAQRKQFEQQNQAILTDYQQRTQHLSQLAQALEVEINSLNNPQELQRLANDDPGEYAKRMLQMQHRHQMIQAAQQQRMQLDAQQQQARVPYERAALAQKNRSFAEDFDTTYQKVGEWVLDPAGGGLSPDIWNGVFDHRFVDIAHKAMMWDKMQREAASTAAPRIREHAQRKPAIVRPGVSQPAKSARKEATQEYQRILADPAAMRTNDGIAAAFLAREKMRRG